MGVLYSTILQMMIEYHDQIAYCLSNEVPVDVIGIQTHMHHLQDAIP